MTTQVLDTTREWQQRTIDEIVAACQEMLREADDDQVMAAKVKLLLSTVRAEMTEIRKHRVAAYEAQLNGDSDTLVKNLRTMSDLIHNSGLPGAAICIAEIKTQVDEHERRIGDLERASRGNADDIGFLQGEITKLTERVDQLERGNAAAPTDELPALRRTDKKRAPAVKDPIRDWIKANIGLQKLPVREAFSRSRYKPQHAGR